MRARTIMEQLDFNRGLLEKHFKDKNFLGAGGVRITRGDRQLIALGRALIMNPEIIIAHKPTALLDDKHTGKVLELFREFTEKRGVLMPVSEPFIRRRKRTIIFTAKNADVASKAHLVYQVRLALAPRRQCRSNVLACTCVFPVLCSSFFTACVYSSRLLRATLT